MKVLLDHNIPHSLRPLLSGEHEVYTTKYVGWSDYGDGQLLKSAVEASFAAIVTLDRSLPHQQATRAYPLGIIVLDVHPTTPAHLKTRIDRVQEALPRAAAEQTVIVLD
jgi:predicted nuclease of predicted toxin-antitoxin system